MLLYLKAHGANVAVPVARLDKQYVTQVNAPEGVRYIVLFEYVQGSALGFDGINKVDIQMYAHAMANMHQALDGFHSVHKRQSLNLDYLLYESIDVIKSFIPHRANDCLYLDELTENIVKKYGDCIRLGPSAGFCHGDLNGDNAHLYNDSLALFDFDCCGTGHYAYDLAVFIWGGRMAKRQPGTEEVFLSAYQEKRPLNNADMMLIPLYVGIRHFWHMALHISLADSRGRSALNDQYFDQHIMFLKEWQQQTF